MPCRAEWQVVTVSVRSLGLMPIQHVPGGGLGLSYLVGKMLDSIDDARALPRGLFSVEISIRIRNSLSVLGNMAV
jgi:hypothetical protein